MVITDVLKARREMLGLDETVPEERIKAEEYMCTRFRCLRKQLEEYYIKYFGKDTEVQVDSEEKNRRWTD